MKKIVDEFIKKFLLIKIIDDKYKLNKSLSGSIGIISDVGTGKSFFLNILYELLNKNKDSNYEVIYIDIAKYQFEKDIFFVLYFECFKQLLSKEQWKDSVIKSINLIYDLMKQGKKIIILKLKLFLI
jgi:type II secretory pathway predicted ATPase ExeA